MASSDGGVVDPHGTALDKHLQGAVKEPRLVKTEDGGSILSLALHCLMVEDGFAIAADRKHGTSPYAPAADWNGKYDNEWVFEYRRHGYANEFTLHCSLQVATGKMFVHAREKDNSGNMRYMGLLVDKYVPDLSKAQQRSWPGVVAEQDALKEALLEFIAGPLLETAIPSEEPEEEPQSVIRNWIDTASAQCSSMYNSKFGRDFAIGAAAIGIAAAALYFLARDRRSQRRP